MLRVPTRDGDLWFKASAPPHAFEARLLAILDRVRPGVVPSLVSHDPARGWLLMRDAGVRLRELVRDAADLDHWERLLPGYAQLQLAAASHTDDVLAAGVPDQRLAVLPAQLAAVLDDPAAVLLGEPDGLTEEERERLAGLLPRFRVACERLFALGVPETIQHDDLHDGNVFVSGDGYRIVDWGDSCVSHPFHSLVVASRAIAHRFELEPGGAEILRLRDAYLEPFSAYGTHAELAAAAELAHLTGTAARALAWHRFVSARPPELRTEDADAVPYGLRRLLAPGPLGSWA